MLFITEAFLQMPHQTLPPPHWTYGSSAHSSQRELKLAYQDDLIGTDADLHIGNSRILFDAFNPSYNRYHLSDVLLQSGKGRVRLYAPLRAATRDTIPPIASADTLDLKLGRIRLENYEVAYTDEVGKLETNAKIGKLMVEGKELFLHKPSVIFA
ncbi:MAG: hypothetical protein R2822_20495 [Spirosomataceae bacterium]